MLFLSSPVTGEMNELAGQLGIATLLFFALAAVVGVLFVYIRSQARQQDDRIRNEREIYTSIISTIREDREKDQKILMGALEDNRQQISMMKTLIEKMKGQEMNLQVLLNKTSSLLENRCIHNLKKTDT